jgi:hypothetical protein
MHCESLRAIHSDKAPGRHLKGTSDIVIPIRKLEAESSEANEIRESILNIEGESWYGSAYFEANETNIFKTLSAAANQYGDRPDNLKVITIVFSEHGWAIKA